MGENLVKRWTNEELLLPGQVVDQAVIAALCSGEGDEADGERTEGVTSGRIEHKVRPNHITF